MYKIENQEFPNLDLAMAYAKTLNKFVTIQGTDFEICGIFGVASIVNNKTPDGVDYTWNKRDRIGKMRKSKQPLVDEKPERE